MTLDDDDSDRITPPLPGTMGARTWANPSTLPPKKPEPSPAVARRPTPRPPNAPRRSSPPPPTQATPVIEKPDETVAVSLPDAVSASRKNRKRNVQKPLFLAKPASGRELVSFYRSLSAMMGAGVPLFACFEFLAREGENRALAEACRRVSQRLVEGLPLPFACSKEPAFFDQKAIRLMEVGTQSGTLLTILERLAEDEEEAWSLSNRLRSQLTYPIGVALLGTLAVMLLPPLVLNDLLEQVVKLTAEPPPITRFLMAFSAVIGSGWFLTGIALTIVILLLFLRTEAWARLKDRWEVTLWQVPALGALWQSLVAVRFLSVFSLTYECGMPATQCLTLSASATGSRLAHQRGNLMKESLVAGATLRECFEAGGFLPAIALESVEAGQHTGTVPTMLQNSAKILKAELQTRIDAVTKLVEPIVLAGLGIFVGTFALGCLLPIIKLAETL